MERFRQEPLDLSGLARINYSRYFLKANPFPAMGIPEEVPLTTADRKEIIDRFREDLRRTIFEGKSSVIVVTGDYGAGKSHLLKYCKYRVNTQLLTSTNKSIAVYIKSAGRNFKDLYLYFIDDIGRDFLTNYAVGIIKSYVEKNESKMREYLYDKTLQQVTRLASVDTDRLLKGMQFYDFLHDLAGTYEGPRNFIMNALLCLAHPDYSSIAWQWFVGEKLSSDEKQMIKVDDSIEDAKDAQKAFGAMIRLFRQFGFMAIVLLMDEFEKFTLIPKNRRDEYMDEIRHFLDENPSGICYMIGVTPTAYKTLTETPSALTRRLSGTEFELRFFKLQDVEELVSRYIQIGRMENANLESVVRKHPNTTPFIYPFTDDALRRIDQRSKGLVSSIVKLCRESIEIGIESKSEVIDRRIIDLVSL